MEDEDIELEAMEIAAEVKAAVVDVMVVVMAGVFDGTDEAEG